MLLQKAFEVFSMTLMSIPNTIMIFSLKTRMAPPFKRETGQCNTRLQILLILVEPSHKSEDLGGLCVWGSTALQIAVAPLQRKFIANQKENMQKHGSWLLRPNKTKTVWIHICLLTGFKNLDTQIVWVAVRGSCRIRLLSRRPWVVD